MDVNFGSLSIQEISPASPHGGHDSLKSLPTSRLPSGSRLTSSRTSFLVRPSVVDGLPFIEFPGQRRSRTKRSVVARAPPSLFAEVRRRLYPSPVARP